MTDKQIIDDVHILYICSYGQTEVPICVDLEHRHCKLKSQKSKKCNLRPVVSYEEYKRKQQKLERITNMLFTGQCSNCEGYSPNCSNKELCDFKHNIKNIIDEVENAK